MAVFITVNKQPATGIAAELHFIEWCLSLENEGAAGVPRTALDAASTWQRGTYRGDDEAASLLERAGITVRHTPEPQRGLNPAALEAALVFAAGLGGAALEF